MSEPTTQTEDLLGTVVDDRYVLESRLGGGGGGTVYRARHAKVGRVFAMKVLHARFIDNAKMVERFDREATLGARLRHPNVIGVVDSGVTADGRPYMVFELGEGPDLGEILSRGAVGDGRTINLTRQLLLGLAHAHRLGLVHRDLKPENVIVETDTNGAEVPRIVDFGLAFEQHDVLADGTARIAGARLTTDGLVLGTPAYMSPEQATAGKLDHRTDLFALGVMVYELLAGKLPFEGDGVTVARANLTRTPPAIFERTRGIMVDPLLEAFALRLMAKRPSERFTDATAAIATLDCITVDRPAAGVLLGVDHMPRALLETGQAAPLEQLNDRGELDPVGDPDAVPEIAIGRGWWLAISASLALAATFVGWVMRVPEAATTTTPQLTTATAEHTSAPNVRESAFEWPPPPIATPPDVHDVVAGPPVSAGHTTMSPRKPPERVIDATPDEVARAYVASGALLDQVAKRRPDRAALDPLWTTYRRIRLTQALATPTSRYVAKAMLVEIDRRVREFAASPMTRPSDP